MTPRSDVLLHCVRSSAALAEVAHASAHDPQEPLRKVITYAARVLVRDADGIGADGTEDVLRMSAAVERMRTLIDGILFHAKTSITPSQIGSVDLGVVAHPDPNTQ